MEKLSYLKYLWKRQFQNHFIVWHIKNENDMSNYNVVSYVKNDKRYLVYSNDMGENWKDIFWGIGDDEKIFKTSSQIKFIN